MRYFETIKCEDFEIFHLNYHKKRVMNTIGLNINLEEYIYPPTKDLLKCKVVYDQSGVLEVSFDKYTKKDIKIFKLVYNDKIIYDKKNINRFEINNLLLKKEKSDEIIIIQNNLVTDTSIANIAIFFNDEWITPNQPLLQGITKNRLIEKGKLKPKDITVKMLKKCTKIATLNAMVDFNIIEDFEIIN
jgi:4-amino-4-deoxychorismate lyase